MSKRLPTLANLLARLREIEEAESGHKLSDEALAAKLPISLSTLNRWKRLSADDSTRFDQIVELLDIAGWLNIDADARGVEARPPDRLEELVARVAELARGQARIAGELGVDLAADAPTAARRKPAQGRPKRTQGKGH